MKRTRVHPLFTSALVVGVLVAAVCLGCAALDCHEHPGGQSARTAALAGAARAAQAAPSLSTILGLLALVALVAMPLAEHTSLIEGKTAVPLRV